MSSTIPTTMSMMIEEEPPAAADDGPSCCYLSTKDTAKQVPQSDIARISFYLRCCVLGCGLLNNNKNNRIPHQLMDFTSAPTLPLNCQNMIYRLAFEGFPLSKLLNRGIIHIDTHETVLPNGVSTMFLSPNSTEYIEAMNRLRPTILLPSTYDGNIMICSSEWIHNHYIHPFQRYYCSNDGMSTNDDDHHHTTSTTILQDSHQSTKQGRQERTTSTEKKDLAHGYDVDIDQDDDIPMVAAVPMPQEEEEEDDHHDDDDPMMTTTTSQEHDEVSSSWIVVGQMVKLIGLEEASEMNDVVGYVVQKINNRLIVDVPNHESQYSIRVENVMIVISSTTTTTINTPRDDDERRRPI